MAVSTEYQIYWAKLDGIEAEEWNLIYNFIAKFNSQIFVSDTMFQV
jgi:hypothetical protein